MRHPARGVIVHHLLHIGQDRVTRRVLDCALVFYTPAVSSLLQSHGVTIVLCAHGATQAVVRRWRALCRLGTYEL